MEDSQNKQTELLQVDDLEQSKCQKCRPITVKPFNLAALKVGDFARKIILAPFILAN